MTAIMARNLAVIEKYSKVIVTECNGCFSTLTQAVESLNNKRIKEKIDPIISKYGYKLSNDFLIIHIIELYFKILPKIVELKKFDLRNIRIAAHYGCNFARAHPEQIITDPQNPQIIEKIIENCNGIPLQYTEMGCCCGAGIIQRNINPDLSLDVSYQKMKSISEVDPDLIVTICPFCMSTLENCQLSLEVEKNLELSIPVIHISELIGVILGFDPVSELGLNSHAIDLMPVIKKIREG